ncbi:MAG: bifunctional nicotinamidase/pyrazinamidase [Deltaproteobacteria bacterium]|nr:bifunctional nicotinamidase/pyrazinamidase [Deltaproteobacteria bacterium]
MLGGRCPTKNGVVALREPKRHGKRALLIVDPQNAFMPGGALAVKHGDRIVPVANRLMGLFDLVVVSLDWHPANHGSFVTQHPGKQVFDVIDLHGIQQVLWPKHAPRGRKGSDIHPGLDRKRITHLVLKGNDKRVDSYSAFYDNGRRSSTGLAAYLRSKGIEELYVMGLATDYCVKFTVLDAVKEGFTTHVIKAGCRGVNARRGDSGRAVKAMKKAGAKILGDAALEALLGGAPQAARGKRGQP